MTSEAIFKVHHLTVTYDKIPVLWDVSFELGKGHLVGIIGPNGAGKSTLIQVVLGLKKPISGQAEFFGQPLKRVRSRVAYVPQRGSVDWEFPITAKEVVLMGCYGKLGLLKRPSRTEWEQVDHCLELVGMQAYADRQISQLSGGQQQRIFIARALMQDAELYFMDEPFVGVDLTSEKVIVQILSDLRKKGKTICIVHHDLNTVNEYFDWLIMLNMRLVACGPIGDVFCKEKVEQTYGKNNALFAEALKLTGNKQSGLEVEE